MPQHKIDLTFLFFATSIAFAFCGPVAKSAVSPETFPTRYIDRPYTLPTGVHELDFSIDGTSPIAPEGNSYYSISPSYRQALSENYTLLWAPLPLGIQYQPIRSNSETLGVSWSLGFDFTQADFSLQPTFTSFYLTKIDSYAAWETRLLYFWNFPLGESMATWSGEISTGPVFQTSDYFALSPRLGFDVKNFALRNIINNTNVTSPDYTYFVDLRAQLAGGHMWEITADTKLDGFNFIGINTQFLQVGITLSEYW